MPDFILDQRGAQIIADVRLCDEMVPGIILPGVSLIDKQVRVTDRVENFELIQLGRMQGYEHQSPFAAQLPEEVHHEGDISILCVELRFVEEMDQWIIRLRPFEHKT